MLRTQVDTQASLLAFTTSLSSQVQLPPAHHALILHSFPSAPLSDPKMMMMRMMMMVMMMISPFGLWVRDVQEPLVKLSATPQAL